MQRRHQQRQSPVTQEYSQLAKVYDQKWSFYVERTTRETIVRLGLRPEENLLDIGCGTGALLQTLAVKHPADRLSGIDPVGEMLGVARRKLPTGVRLFQAWAESLPFEAECFDVVVSCNVFHYIRQPTAALQEMARVLRPGGRIIITDWCDDYLACRLCDIYLRLFNRSHGKVYGERECTHLLDETGYTVASIDRYKINWLWGLMTARATKPISAVA